MSYILETETHITKKIRQVLNFLKVTYKFGGDTIWKIPKGNTVELELELEQIHQWLEIFEIDKDNLPPPSELIDSVWPGFFNVDLKLQEEKTEKELEFGALSSGEQQMILNINAILYHLYNLQSVHKSAGNLKVRNSHHSGYSSINITLDEVELYYHPDMQRKLVKELVYNLERVKQKEQNGITGINICILTHSPFILSDIPDNNVLRLYDTGIDVDDYTPKTFGANIHDLLANDFFLNNGFMGEFAKDKINEVVDKLRDNTNYTPSEQRELLATIELIGEDILRNSLLELYGKKFDKPSYGELLEFYNKNSNGANQQ